MPQQVAAAFFLCIFLTSSIAEHYCCDQAMMTIANFRSACTRGLAATVLAVMAFAVTTPVRASERILVFAAASVADAIEQAADEFSASGRDHIVVSVAASSTLAKQIAAGAPANLFISADTDWVDWLARNKHADVNAQRIVARNRLVVARKAGEVVAGDLREALGQGRIAMGDPGHVPAGRYAKQALVSEGVWETVVPRAVYGENVRVAVEYLRNGAVDAAIVYASDAALYQDIVPVFTFAEHDHDAIIYPMIIPGGSDGRAGAFADFLASSDGQSILLEYGFLPAKP